MFRGWLTSLPTAILALFLLGFPCHAMMMFMQAPAEPADHCCQDCKGNKQTPAQGCETLCVASASARIVVQSADDSAIGLPVDCGPVAPIAPDPLLVGGEWAAPMESARPESPPLYLQNSSFLI